MIGQRWCYADEPARRSLSRTFDASSAGTERARSCVSVAFTPSLGKLILLPECFDPVLQGRAAVRHFFDACPRSYYLLFPELLRLVRAMALTDCLHLLQAVVCTSFRARPLVPGHHLGRRRNHSTRLYSSVGVSAQSLRRDSLTRVLYFASEDGEIDFTHARITKERYETRCTKFRGRETGTGRMASTKKINVKPKNTLNSVWLGGAGYHPIRREVPYYYLFVDLRHNGAMKDRAFPM